MFDYYKSNKKTIGLISIPHSGTHIPDIFKNYIIVDNNKLLIDNDYKVQELIDISYLNNNGIDVLIYNINRVCVDLNRYKNESILFWKKNTQGDVLVIDEPNLITKYKLINLYYKPYYDKINQIISNKMCVIDLHSMPSIATDYHLRLNKNQPINRPDFCLSDLNGISCENKFIQIFNNELLKIGFDSKINNPYFGGYLTKYINDNFNVNNIQIEINRKLYMDEKKFILKNNIKLTNILSELISNVFKYFYYKN